MLKQLSRVRVEFNAHDKRASWALEFLAQCNSRKARSSNPNIEAVVKQRTANFPPVVRWHLGSGREEVIIDGIALIAQPRKSVSEQTKLVNPEKMLRGLEDDELIDTEALCNKRHSMVKAFNPEWGCPHGQFGCGHESIQR